MGSTLDFYRIVQSCEWIKAIQSIVNILYKIYFHYYNKCSFWVSDKDPNQPFQISYVQEKIREKWGFFQNKWWGSFIVDLKCLVIVSRDRNFIHLTMNTAASTFVWCTMKHHLNVSKVQWILLYSESSLYDINPFFIVYQHIIHLFSFKYFLLGPILHKKIKIDIMIDAMIF